MIRSLILLMLCQHGSWAYNSPCTDDSHCDVNYYCELNTYQCLECLRCEDFRRAAPPVSTDCIKSVVDCGPCTERDRHGGGRDNKDCGAVNERKVNNNVDNNLLRDLGTRDIQLPVYIWILIVIIVAVLVITLGLILKSSVVNKMMTYSLVCRTARQRSPSGDFPASAPEPPPAYHAVYEMESSALLLDAAKFEHAPESCMSKPVAGIQLDETRESADRQAAVPYNHPVYVRSAPMAVSNWPPTNAAGAGMSHSDDADGAIADNSSVGDQSVVDGVSGRMSDGDVSPQPSNNSTVITGACSNIETNHPTLNDSGHSYSNSSSEPSGAQVIVLNNIVNLQAVISDSKSIST